MAVLRLPRMRTAGLSEAAKAKLKRQCWDKARYPTPERALRAVKDALRKRGAVLDTYRCLYCDGYHLTSKPAL